MFSVIELLPIATFGLTGTQLALLAVGAAGAGASIYGANKQAGAIEDANKANIATQDKTNAGQWAAYLMSRGVNPAGAVTGQIPTNPQAINSRLPLWANANFSTGRSGWRKKGAAGATPNTLTRAAPIAPYQGGAGSSYQGGGTVPGEYENNLYG